MLFYDISILDETLALQEHRYVATRGERIAYIGAEPPKEDFGRRIDGRGKLLMCGFYNAHGHSPMTLMRGYGENLALQDWLNTRIFPFEDKLTGDAVYWATLLAMAESLRFGIVSTSDMYYFCDDMARAVAESGAKANISRSIVAFDDADLAQMQSFAECRALVRDWQGAQDGRIIVDSSLHAEYTSTEKVARQLADYTAENHLRMHVHVSETAEEVAACKQRHGGRTPVRYLADCGIFDSPATAAHCVHLEREDFDILAEKQVAVASCPVSNLKLASGVCDAAGLLAKGVTVALGTDSVASNNSLNFIEEMKAFALVSKGFRGDPTLITPAQALCAATQGGAAAQGRADCGRLAQGMRADLVMLDLTGPHMHPIHDLPGNLVYSASGSDVCMTVVDGRVLYENGAYTTIDLERAVHEVDRAVRDILLRLS